MATELLRGMTHPEDLQTLDYSFLYSPLCRLGKQRFKKKKKKNEKLCLSFSLVGRDFLRHTWTARRERNTRPSGPTPFSKMISQLVRRCDLPVAADSLILCCLFVMHPRQTPKWLFKTASVLFFGTESTIIQKSVDKATIHNCQNENKISINCSSYWRD